MLKGDCNLGVLVNSTGLSGKLVREALFVLIQHSLVLFNTSITPVLYRLDVEAVILRIGYGQVVAQVSHEISTEAADLLLDIMAVGRFNTNDLLNQQQQLNQERKDSLKLLLQNDFIQIVTPEMAHFSYSTDEDGHVIEPAPSASTSTASSAAAAVGNKRKLDNLFSTENDKKLKISFDSSNSSSSPIFVRFNAKITIHRSILTKKLVESVAKRLNKTAGKIVETILSLATETSNSSTFFSGSVVNFNTFQLSQKLPKDLQFPLDTSASSGGGLAASPLQQYLLILANNFDYIQLQSSLGSNTFSLDISKAIRHLRLLSLESFIRSRFGLPSARIFKILLAKRMFEERQIAKVAMITGKEVRERLFALLRLGLVQLQEVPKTADHAPSRTIFLWSVPERANFSRPAKSSLFRTFASKIAVALVNLRDLATLERRKNGQLLEKVERSDVASNLHLLSPQEQKQLADLKKILQILQVKSMQVFDDLILLKE